MTNIIDQIKAGLTKDIQQVLQGDMPILKYSIAQNGLLNYSAIQCFLLLQILERLDDINGNILDVEQAILNSNDTKEITE